MFRNEKLREHFRPLSLFPNDLKFSIWIKVKKRKVSSERNENWFGALTFDVMKQSRGFKLQEQESLCSLVQRSWTDHRLGNGLDGALVLRANTLRNLWPSLFNKFSFDCIAVSNSHKYMTVHAQHTENFEAWQRMQRFTFPNPIIIKINSTTWCKTCITNVYIKCEVRIKWKNLFSINRRGSKVSLQSRWRSHDYIKKVKLYKCLCRYKENKLRKKKVITKVKLIRKVFAKWKT